MSESENADISNNKRKADEITPGADEAQLQVEDTTAPKVDEGGQQPVDAVRATELTSAEVVPVAENLGDDKLASSETGPIVDDSPSQAHPEAGAADDEIKTETETKSEAEGETVEVTLAENLVGERRQDDGSSNEDEPQKARTNEYETLKYMVVTNDGHPESMIKLVGLKSLFSKQLPKMPKAYIARLVFDRRHTSLAILSDNPALKESDEEIIGGICYRTFPDMKFAEIAFCAVNATHQVKGYGSKLMNLLKKIGAETGIEYFITYADNYAMGYFKKQGFSKSISMPKGRYSGLCKEYDGATPMECYVHSSVDFTQINEMLDAQRNFILSQVERHANSHTVYDPLPNNFAPDLEGVSRANHTAARAMAIPGIQEAGWTMADLVAATGAGKDADRQRGALKSELLAIVRKIQEQHFSWPFREPVDTVTVSDYLEVIQEPIDLSTIDKRIRQDNHYKSKQMLFADLMLMVNNCKVYNEENSPYVHCANNVEKMLGTLFHDMNAAKS